MENKWDAHQQQEPCSDNSLVFICKFPVREGFQVLDSQEPIQIKLPAQCHVHQLRVHLCMQAEENNNFLSHLRFWIQNDIVHRTTRRRRRGMKFMMTIRYYKTLDAPWFQGTDGLQTVCVTVLAQKTTSKERIHFQGILNELIGYDLDSSDTNRLSGGGILDWRLPASCLENMLELHLSVVAISSLPENTVSREYWPLVDSLTGLSSSHEELSLNEDIVMISIWDSERKFRVKLLWFDIPELPSKVLPLIHVEATIIYGRETVSSVCSTSKEFTDEVLWNTWLEFDIPHGWNLQSRMSIGFKPYQDSCLARFLLKRALRMSHECSFILEAYLLVINCLHKVALTVKVLYTDRTDLPSTGSNNCVLNCKVMASKKKPLWLEFSCVQSEAPASPPVSIIFKHGDDLRQDMLIIQTLMVMESIWKERGLDLNLVPYGCISIGYNTDCAKCVTIASVQRSQGGVAGAFKNNALYDYGRRLVSNIIHHFQAMEKFVNLCVATYVLGIGDRHNDNIIITDQGKGTKRVPFVLTPDFLYVMGRVKGHLYQWCPYLSLRAQSHLLVMLFSLILLTGIPELSMSQDMCYLRTALQQDQGEEEARNHFLQQIALCEQKGWSVKANWWFHMMAGIK
uniref:Si:rp71-17i16.5 n=1 Tax=Cyprinus carpio carpio TaxID=630221 RepID=A0A9J7ZI56_CYPCA